MVKKSMKDSIQRIIAPVDIRINGNRQWDIQVHNPKSYARILAGGSLALGESYMDGWWDCKALDQFFYKVIRAELENKTENKVNELKSAKLDNIDWYLYPLSLDAWSSKLYGNNGLLERFNIGKSWLGQRLSYLWNIQSKNKIECTKRE